MSRKQRRPGPSPVDRIWTRGEPSLTKPLAAALSITEAEARWTHGFHTYPAGLPAEATRILLEALPPGTVLDPFCGGGTVLVEAQGRGRAAHGADLSPVAELTATTRTWRPTPEQITAFRSASRRITAAAREQPVVPTDRDRVETETWFEPHVMGELEGLRLGIESAPEDVRPALRCCLSSIIVKVSLRASDTSQKRVERHRPHGTTAVLFHKKCRELGRRLESYIADVPADTPQATITLADARSWTPEAPAQALLTSPPYPGVYDYIPLQALRVAWLGLDHTLGLRKEIASRRGFRADRKRAMGTWRADSKAWFQNMAQAVEPGGRAILVIGDGHVGDKLIDALAETAASAEQGGWRPLASATGERPDPARRSPRCEHVLLLERP